MKTFSWAMSQGDKPTDVLHKEKYSHNCELEETLCTARTTAREREREPCTKARWPRDTRQQVPQVNA